MKSVLAGQGHAKLCNAGMEAVVASVQLGVPVDADVERLRERSSERQAERDAPASERHAVAEVGVCGVALGRRPDVHHLPPVVLAEHGDEVVGGQHSVVVDEHEPPRSPSADEPHGLGRDARDPESGGVARGVGVPEVRCVLGYPDRREGVLAGAAGLRRGGRAGVEPDVASHRGGVPPQADVLAAAQPYVRGPRDAEDDVTEVEWRGCVGVRQRRARRIRDHGVPRDRQGPLGRGEHEEEPERGGEEHREQGQQRGGERAVPRREESEREERLRRGGGVVGLEHWAWGWGRGWTTPPPVSTDIWGCRDVALF
jgi:hypothetical protein